MIQDSLKNPFGKIAKYILFRGELADFEPGAKEGEGLIKKIIEFLDETP
jgi:hypothetical protein